MKATPTDDDCFGKGYIRTDGRKIHPSYLFEVKSPAESRHQWDLYKARCDHAPRTGIPAAQRGRLPVGAYLSKSEAPKKMHANAGA
jgi:hypothetical protein